MKAPIKHHSVNWVDGMKLTQQHLRDIDAHFHDSIRDGVFNRIKLLQLWFAACYARARWKIVKLNGS